MPVGDVSKRAAERPEEMTEVGVYRGARNGKYTECHANASIRLISRKL